MSFTKLLAAGKSLVGMPDTNCRYRVRTENLLPKFISPKNPFARPAPKPAAPAPRRAETGPATAARMETAPLFEAERAETEAAREVKPSIARASGAVKVEICPVEVNGSSEPGPVGSSAFTRQTTKGPSGPSRMRDGTTNPEAKTPPAPAQDGTTTLEFKAPPAPETKAPQLLLGSKPVTPAKKSGSWFGWIKKLNPLALLPKGHGGVMASRGRIGKSHVQAELSLDRVQVVRNDLRDADLEIVPGRLMGMPSGASPILMNSARPDTRGWSRLATHLMGVEQTQI